MYVLCLFFKLSCLFLLKSVDKHKRLIYSSLILPMAVMMRRTANLCATLYWYPKRFLTWSRTASSEYLWLRWGQKQVFLRPSDLQLDFSNGRVDEQRIVGSSCLLKAESNFGLEIGFDTKVNEIFKIYTPITCTYIC